MPILHRTKVAAATRPRNAKSGYLPTLDGWRAVAILSVILCHCRDYSFGPVGTGWFYNHGAIGVDLFFAISGFLICSRLLEEEQTFGRISLKNFYIRRACRILPPAFFMLSVVGVLILEGVFRITLREWLAALFFLHNYSSLSGPLGPDTFFVNHFWSLAVEEHFYLILPAVLALTRKGWRIAALAGLTLVVEIHRVLVLRTSPWGTVGYHTGILLDYLLIPAILAVLVRNETIRAGLKKWLRAWPLLLIVVVLLATFAGQGAWQMTAQAALLPLLILGTVLNARGFPARALEWPPLRYLGRISYGVYLWQELFFTGHFHAERSPLGALEHFPLQFVATFAIAIGSYYFLEKPMIRLGHRLAPPATPGRGDIPEESSRRAPISKQAGALACAPAAPEIHEHR